MPLKFPISETDHAFGNANAPIELLEYGDYQCPFCGQAYPIIKWIQTQLGNDLRFIYRNFPLSKTHPQAKQAAIASEAAARQDKFWQMHDLLFEHQKRLHTTQLIEYAQQLELDIEKFRADMDDAQLAKKVESDFYGGMRSGVNATPTFFVNGEKYKDSWQDGEIFLKNLRALNLVS
ncbi:DsbA family protein [Polluticoccus soli]|uniref:DsbA family protein n=1 Tax=Polluticoccus soli TaxID=3034150 RepID=UPI0023E2E97F|nr:DsbA family protein [Flavipsychrobacter sp. JY13-12]